MTDFAFGAECGLPSGGRHPESEDSARARPSRNNIALRARPVKPMPVSARNERRVMPGQLWLSDLIMVLKRTRFPIPEQVYRFRRSVHLQEGLGQMSMALTEAQ